MADERDKPPRPPAPQQGAASASGTGPTSGVGPEPSTGPASGVGPEPGADAGRRRHPGHHKPPRTAGGWRVEGAPPPSPGQPGGERPKASGGAQWLRRIWLIVVAALVVNWIIVAAMTRPSPYLTTSYTFFRQQVEAGNVAQITSQGQHRPGRLQARSDGPPGDGCARLERVRLGRRLEAPARARAARRPPALRTPGSRPSSRRSATTTFWRCSPPKGVVVNAKPLASGTPLWETLLLYFGPALAFVALFMYLEPAGGRGRRRHAERLRAIPRAPLRALQQQRTTFADVAGIDEAKAELTEVVDFLREPERYRRLGARIPRGVLLSAAARHGQDAARPSRGRRGRRAVLLAVGLGVRRDVRRGRAPAACAISSRRPRPRPRRSSSSTSSTPSAGPAAPAASLGGNDEREQTLNQILTEMDGFTGTEGVIVMAATNRAEVLDPALLRPGRFDRRVTVEPARPEGPRRHPARARPRRAAGPPTSTSTASPHRRPAWWAPTSPTSSTRPRWLAARRRHERVGQRDLSRRSRARRARLGAAHRALRRGARADRLPRVRARPARHAAGGRRPGAQGHDRAARPGARRHLPEPREPTATATPRPTCGAASPAPSADAPRRSSSTAT